MTGQIYRPMSVKYFSIVYRFTVVLITVAITTSSGNKVDDNLKQMVEEAGCPFISIKQLLVRNVCLMPDYQFTELPNSEGITNVYIRLQDAYILEVAEKKNTITFKISQIMKWWEPRIRANFSAVPQQNGIIKLSPTNFKSIWHPNLYIDTQDVHEWKSLYAPRFFKDMVVLSHNYSTTAPLPNYQLNQNGTTLRVTREWRATLFCKFDFSTFPLDTQHCAFLQWRTSDNIHILLHPSKITKRWKYKTSGFEITITHVGTFVDYNVTLQNAIDPTGFNITLERIVHPYLYQYYFPCIAIVVVSQISFIIPLSAIPGRAAFELRPHHFASQGAYNFSYVIVVNKDTYIGFTMSILI